MEFAHLFSIMTVVGAVLFFTAGVAIGALKSKEPQDRAEMSMALGPEQERALQEAAAREMAASEAAARESAARQAAASDAALRRAECDHLRAQLTACQEALLAAQGRYGDSDAAAKRAEALHAENTRLRAEARAAASEIARLKASLAAGDSHNGADAGSLAPAVLDTSSGGATFQGILGRISKTKGMRSAVLGDALGLPVAAFGDQSESLAGFCGFISQAASKAHDFLQLGSIRRIVIEDDRLSTLTACSIAGTDIFLATLTSGPGPEFARMVQVLNDVKSFMSQRSRA